MATEREEALFTAAVEFVLDHEGGYVDDPDDPGGETKFGITKRQYPDLDIRDLTREEAIAIYRRDFWNKGRYRELPADVAIKCFDLAVNMGPRPAAIVLQRALRACRYAVRVDGAVGPKTLRAANTADPKCLLVGLRAEAAAHYRVLATSMGAGEKFLGGWLERAYA